MFGRVILWQPQNQTLLAITFGAGKASKIVVDASFRPQSDLYAEKYWMAFL